MPTRRRERLVRLDSSEISRDGWLLFRDVIFDEAGDGLRYDTVCEEVLEADALHGEALQQGPDQMLKVRTQYALLGELDDVVRCLNPSEKLHMVASPEWRLSGDHLEQNGAD